MTTGPFLRSVDCVGPAALRYSGDGKAAPDGSSAHHREPHRQSDEAVWWNKIEIDPIAAARLTQQTALRSMNTPTYDNFHRTISKLLL